MNSVVVYTCAVGDYDWIHSPRVAPQGVDFLRLSDRKPLFAGAWRHRDLPIVADAPTPRAKARYAKVHPHVVVPGFEIAIWIDSSVEVMDDIQPFARAFAATGADVALFRHPSGRSVDEEIDFAIKAGRISPDFYEAAARQRERYDAAGVLDCKIAESTIVVYRPASEALRAACNLWGNELAAYTERDQVSQPFAMRDEKLRIHFWDWHFDEPNPYFRRIPHRPRSTLKRLLTGAHFLGDSRLDYRLVRYVVRGARMVKRAGRSLRSG